MGIAVRDPQNPYRITQQRIENFDNIKGGLLDLAWVLMMEPQAIKQRLIFDLMRGAARRHAAMEVPGQVIVALRKDAENIAKADRAKVKALEKDDGTASGNAHYIRPVMAVLRALFRRFEYDSCNRDLHCWWNGITLDGPDPGSVCIPIGSGQADANNTLFRHLGPFEMFCKSICNGAKAKEVLLALQEIARLAPERDVASAGSEPVELVQAILGMRVWVDETVTEMTPAGVPVERTRRFPARLESRPGVYPPEGVAYFNDPAGRFLYVYPNAVIPALPARFRQKRAVEVRNLLWDAPGSSRTDTKTGYSCRSEVESANNGNWKTIRVNLDRFDAALAATDAQSPAAETPPAPGPAIVPDAPTDAQHTDYMLGTVSVTEGARMAENPHENQGLRLAQGEFSSFETVGSVGDERFSLQDRAFRANGPGNKLVGGLP